MDTMYDERAFGYEMIKKLEAIDHWDAIVKLAKALEVSEAQRAGNLAMFEKAAEMQQRAEHTIAVFKDVALEVASLLAFNGNLPHKEKNEAILSAIARLLALHNNYRAEPKTDDIPF